MKIKIENISAALAAREEALQVAVRNFSGGTSLYASERRRIEEAAGIAFDRAIKFMTEEVEND